MVKPIINMWAMTDLNRRLPPCKKGTLTRFLIVKTLTLTNVVIIN